MRGIGSAGHRNGFHGQGPLLFHSFSLLCAALCGTDHFVLFLLGPKRCPGGNLTSTFSVFDRSWAVLVVLGAVLGRFWMI